MHTITIDDETLARNQLLRHLRTIDPQGTHVGFRVPEEFLSYIRDHHVDVAFVDVDLYNANGLSLTEQLAEIAPRLNVIMYTGHPQYKAQALDLYVSGYLVKPVSEKDLREVLAHLRYPIKELRVQCFGYFEVFFGSQPVRFERKGSREIFAYLIDKRGARVSEDELRCVLWTEEEDDPKKRSYIRNIIYDIRSTLAQFGENDIIVNQRGYYSIDTDRICCDYYDYLKGKPVPEAALGQYMEQFSDWADATRKRLFG